MMSLNEKKQQTKSDSIPYICSYGSNEVHIAHIKLFMLLNSKALQANYVTLLFASYVTLHLFIFYFVQLFIMLLYIKSIM